MCSVEACVACFFDINIPHEFIFLVEIGSLVSLDVEIVEEIAATAREELSKNNKIANAHGGLVSLSKLFVALVV